MPTPFRVERTYKSLQVVLKYNENTSWCYNDSRFDLFEYNNILDGIYRVNLSNKRFNHIEINSSELTHLSMHNNPNLTSIKLNTPNLQFITLNNTPLSNVYREGKLQRKDTDKIFIKIEKNKDYISWEFKRDDIDMSLMKLNKLQYFHDIFPV